MGVISHRITRGLYELQSILLASQRTWVLHKDCNKAHNIIIPILEPYVHP